MGPPAPSNLRRNGYARFSSRASDAVRPSGGLASFHMRTQTTVITALCGASALALCVTLAATLAASGCTVLTNDALPDDAGTFEAGGDASANDCSSCVTQECTGAWAVCLTDSRCVALRSCDNPLGESGGARAQCFCDTADASASSADGGPDPLAAYAAFASCNDVRTCGACASDCKTACANGAPSTTAGSCAGSTDGGPDAGIDDDAATDAGDAGDAGDDASALPEAPSVDRCAGCVSDRCGDAKKACALGTECSAFLGCAYGCADASCVDECGKSHSTGKASAMELSGCTLTSCSSPCGL